MPFSEKVKLEARKKANFRCVVCNAPIVQIHHIVPQEEKGPDTIENAVALCAHCHNIYGGNPNKRKELINIRDLAYKRIEEKFKPKENFLKVEKAEGSARVVKNKDDIVLKCKISKNENFEQAATKIYNLIYNTQKRFPELNRTLIIEIEGHRNSQGGYDKDMFELQYEFLTKAMFQFIHILHIPLISIENKNPQQDLQSERLLIFDDKEKMKIAQEKIGKTQLLNLN